MKKKYIIVLTIFVIVLIIIFAYFKYLNKEIVLNNETVKIIKDIQNNSEGTYQYNKGYIYLNNEKISNQKYELDGKGTIEIDKYGNVKLQIKVNNKCISKTSEGDIQISNVECPSYNDIDVTINNNNSKISFVTNSKNLEYKISRNDDYKGKWIKQEYSDVITINTFNEGTNYIWFKDTYGNISKAYTFEVKCLNSNGANYNKDIFYCSGATIILDKKNWIVIEDNNSTITLMKRDPINIKLPHCFNVESEFCYYTERKIQEYKWSNSYINYFLNNYFIDELSDDIKNKIEERYICDEYEATGCEGDGCGGYLKEEIESKDYSCTNYTHSKVRIITYNEFSKLSEKQVDEDLIGTYIWTMNSFSKDKASSIQENYEIYINQDPLNKLYVKPIITISK